MSRSNKKAIQVAVYKATNRKPKPSKEKHVRVVVTKTFMRDGSSEEIVKALCRRLEKGNWTVVLKALMIFHRCFKNGDPSFMESLKSRSSIVFSLRGFSQLAPPNHIFTVFVKKYAKYLEEKVSVLRLLGFQFENQKDVCNGIKPPRAFKVVPKLQSQLNALLNCKMRSQHASVNSLISRAYILLLTDSLSLYSTLNSGITSLLDLFWKMSKKEAQRSLDIYNLFVKETDALIGLYDIGKRLVNKLPTVRRAETSIISSMEQYIKNASHKAGDDEDSYSEEVKDQSHLQTQYGNYDEGDYQEGSDSGDPSSSGEADDEPDPFEAFIQGTNNPFATFNFSQPTIPASFQQQMLAAPTVGPAYATNNPFQTVTANPFSAANVQPGANPFATYSQTTVTTTNNPFMTGQPQGVPSFTTGAPGYPVQGAYFANAPGANPFATGVPAGQPRPATGANPFATGNSGSPNPFM